MKKKGNVLKPDTYQLISNFMKTHPGGVKNEVFKLDCLPFPRLAATQNYVKTEILTN